MSNVFQFPANKQNEALDQMYMALNELFEEGDDLEVVLIVKDRKRQHIKIQGTCSDLASIQLLSETAHKLAVKIEQGE